MTTSNDLGKRIWAQGFSAPCGVAVLAALSVFTFLANPFLGVPGCDSSIFIYVARRMMAGQVPYLDMLDHKGLLIYVLDTLGWSCGGVWGIWALDIIAFVLGLLGVAILSRSCIALMVWIALYHFVACGGNMPEMWIIVFSVWAYVLALRAQAQESWKWFLMGACVAMVLMLKLNMIAVTVPLAIVWWWRGHALKSAIWSVAGLLVGLTPFAAYLTLKGGWPALWEVYVLFNAQYAGRSGWIPHLSRAFWPVAALWLTNVALAFRRREPIAWINLSYLTAAWGLVLASGGSVRYYGPVLPACILPLAYLAKAVSSRKWLCGVIVVASFAFVGGLAVARNRSADALRAQYVELEDFRSVIRDQKSVTALGCDCHVYQVLDAVCPGRFPFQGMIAKCSERYRRQMISDMTSGVSRYLIAPKAALERPANYGISWAIEPMGTCYKLVSETAHYKLYEYSPPCMSTSD